MMLVGACLAASYEPTEQKRPCADALLDLYAEQTDTLVDLTAAPGRIRNERRFSRERDTPAQGFAARGGHYNRGNLPLPLLRRLRVANRRVNNRPPRSRFVQ